MIVEANSIILNKDTDEENFWDDVKNLINLLTKYGYEVLIRDEDCGFYSLDIAVSDRDIGDVRFLCVTEEEEEKILLERDQEEE